MAIANDIIFVNILWTLVKNLHPGWVYVFIQKWFILFWNVCPDNYKSRTASKYIAGINAQTD